MDTRTLVEHLNKVFLLNLMTPHEQVGALSFLVGRQLRAIEEAGGEVDTSRWMLWVSEAVAKAKEMSEKEMSEKEMSEKESG